MFQVRLWHGIRQPYTTFTQLHESEDVTGFFGRVIILAVFSAFLSGFGIYMGLDTEMFTTLIGKVSDDRIETMKLIFAIGSIGNGIAAPMLSMYIASLLIWLVLRGKVEFYKIITIELYVMFLDIIEKVLFLIFRLLTGANAYSSPFGLGVIAQLASNHPFFIHFMNSITIFFAWSAVIQIIALRICSSLSSRIVSVIVLAVHLFINLISSLIFFMIQQ
ncbi:YIP1 family protein [Thermaerobacillus caldiproteolyticus]|uniref:YIP1 family protein n=1 Tax=Thermaerobacillus caldiproteolyticus TaxID=247480 RepID=UPI00188C398A|nr:YIP1 family protein [Anoxybacillus caldiproteolyticus]QPA30736.1 YIP1 family protein [Anoxybacillus caldiproteolyticus]